MTGSTASMSSWSWRVCARVCARARACVISQGKSLEILSPAAWELNPGHGEDRQWDALILSLSYHSFISAIICPWLNFILPPRCPQAVRRHWGEIEPFSATLAQDGLAECDQSGKNPLKYSAVAGNWTQSIKKTDSEIHSFSHWAIVTDWAIMADIDSSQNTNLIMRQSTDTDPQVCGASC